MRSPDTDVEGYLTDPADWSEDLATEQARKLGIELNDDHWAALRYMRAFLDEHHVAPDARFVMRHLTETRGAGRIAFSSFSFMASPAKPANWLACGARALGARVEFGHFRRTFSNHLDRGPSPVLPDRPHAPRRRCTDRSCGWCAGSRAAVSDRTSVWRSAAPPHRRRAGPSASRGPAFQVLGTTAW